MTDNQLLVDTSDVVHIDNEETIIGTKTFSHDTVVKNLSPMMTNCITEIPQDIKWELDNGTFILKAGSVLTLPDGTKVTTTADKTGTSSAAAGTKVTFIVNPSNLVISSYYSDAFFSGDTAPTTTYRWGWWYDTANKVMKRTEDYGETWSGSYTFPIATATASGSGIASIDQVFNGFGYIGSAIFALPGVTGLIPNGRNDDGSLKNIELTLSKVLTMTYLAADTVDLNLYQDGATFAGYASSHVYKQKKEPYGYSKMLWFNPEENVYKYTTDGGTSWSIVKLYNIGNAVLTSNTGTVGSITPKTAFHTLDYNDKSTISGWSIPSSKYINLTLGASDTTYTAPANGMFLFSTQLPANSYFAIFNGNTTVNSELLDISISTIVQNYVTKAFVRKGQIIRITYSAINNNNASRFYYLEGEV